MVRTVRNGCRTFFCGGWVWFRELGAHRTGRYVEEGPEHHARRMTRIREGKGEREKAQCRRS